MSKSSESVKKWRKESKARIIEAMGGKCALCGYDKCESALSLHHLDPSKKELSIGGIRANPKSWTKIVDELRKCIMVCNNCHAEIHSGLVLVPSDVILFDEKFAIYKCDQKVLTPCLLCGRLKSKHLKYCSKKCSSESKFKVDWNNIDLIEELKTKSVIKLAEELGCSDVAIHKRLKRFGLK